MSYANRYTAVTAGVTVAKMTNAGNKLPFDFGLLLRCLCAVIISSRSVAEKLLV